MPDKKIAIVMITILLSSMIILSGNASAELHREDMEWLVGYTWEYRMTHELGMVMLLTFEITGEDTVEIDGTSYDVYVAKGTGSIEEIGDMHMPFDMSLVEGSGTITATGYHSKDDITLKIVMNASFQLNYEGEPTDISYSFSVDSEAIERVISGAYPDVIEVGDSWSLTIKEKYTETITISGGIFGDGESETETTTKTKATNYECTGKKSVTVTAGIFDTYEIRETEIGEEGNYTLEYISSEVKREVKSVEYDGEGVIFFVELISYDVTAVTDENDGNGGIPGFEFAFLITAIAIILLKRRNRRNR